MEIKEKNRKLKFIGTTMDLRNGRFKDSELIDYLNLHLIPKNVTDRQNQSRVIPLVGPQMVILTEKKKPPTLSKWTTEAFVLK